jgi:hypothetical protein
MGTARTSTQTVKQAPLSGYAYIGSQMAALIDRFNLDASRSQIMQTYAEICSDSLAFPRDSRPPNYSRINHDGTPIQYAVTIGSSHHTLQFLSEAGCPGITGAARIRVNQECITNLAQRLHALEALSSVRRLLDALAPETDVDLLADPGGAYWIGTAFTAGNEPHLRIYINARWGKEQDRWKRLSQFAAHFDKSQQWQDVATMLAPTMQPLGTAITFHGDEFPSGRIYLSAYGKRMPFYEELASIYGGENFMRQLHKFGKCMLGDDYVYPTQTGVCSLGFSENTILDFKFELCAHCLFASDAEAVARLQCWLETADLDASDYWDMLDILSEGYLGEKANDLHCYVGLGLRRGRPYGTIYLKPRLIAA